MRMTAMMSVSRDLQNLFMDLMPKFYQLIMLGSIPGSTESMY
jgi:hypothetical protein